MTFPSDKTQLTSYFREEEKEKGPGSDGSFQQRKDI